jgi:16S rRNA (uracil1498-N3)-methyltransferase
MAPKQMIRRRFYAPSDAFASDSRTLTLAAEEARHARDVLRLKPGDLVFVFDGEGREFQCRIEESGRSSAQVTVIGEVQPARPESPLRLTLGVALLKGEKFDLVVQKATELGVSFIVPVITKLADMRFRDELEAGKRVARWQRIALEAAKQSGRAFVPQVTAPVAFPSLMKAKCSDGGQRLLFSEIGGDPLVETTKRFATHPVSITAVVGSEGGWTDEEIEQARQCGWYIVTLGGRTLRAETAAIAVAALLQHQFGDVR